MGRFLITGLPRSRTAWWAVATGALHEPISREGWAAFRPKWLSAEGRDLGVSDSFAGLHIEAILEELKPRVLIIERPIPAVIASMQRYAWGVPLDVLEMERALVRLNHALHATAVLDSALVKRVGFSDLDAPGVVVASIRHLQLPAPPNLGQLMRMNVQSQLAHNLHLLAEKVA